MKHIVGALLGAASLLAVGQAEAAAIVAAGLSIGLARSRVR